MNLIGKILAPLSFIGALAATPAAAQSLYITGDVGALSPSDKDIQKIYGVMPVLKLGIGLESNGFGGELDLIGSFKEGTPINLADTPGLSMNSRITNLAVVARASKAFGRSGEDIRPYFGIQGSYNSVTETATATYMGEELASVSASANGFGVGVFVGVDFPLTKKLLLSLEGRYDYTQVNGKINSDSSGSAFAKSGVNTGGLSGGVGIKYFF